jgi:methylated-DNA-[protein]-cysteine S-methyltransferase
MNPFVCYTWLSSPIGELGIFGTKRGVIGLSFHERGFKSLFQRVAATLGVTPVQDGGPLKETVKELERYIAGKTDRVYTDIDLTGISPFRNRVFQVLQEIPYGTVRSYQWVAQQAGNPKASRAVGTACASNPVPILIPCHRVIAKDGSLGGFSSGLKVKKWLLDLEQKSG